MNNEKEYYIYILRCCDDSLYTGITTDIRRRVREHYYKLPKGAKYTKSRGVAALEAVWKAKNKITASKMEYYIKSLPRENKLEVISSGENLEDSDRIFDLSLDSILST